MSVGTLLLPVRIEARAVGGHQAQIVVTLRQQYLRNLLQGYLAAFPAVLPLARAETERQQGHGAIFLRQRTAGEFDDGGETECGVTLLVDVEPAAILGGPAL